MSDPTSGWIEWAGGECPVPHSAADVSVRFRSGEEHTDYEPDGRDWAHSSSPGDIIAYRVVPA